MFFDDWPTLARTLVIATCAYAAVIAVLRISGKRTLSKLNAFDFVLTVALGSTLATIAVSPNVALAEGVATLALLVGLQYLIALASVRLPWLQGVVKSRPTLLVHHGRLRTEALHRERVTHSEILQVVRQEGLSSVGQVAAVVLETDGSLSVVPSIDGPDASALADVSGWDDARHT